MTYDEADALPIGTLVKATQPCDEVEYTWLTTGRIEELINGATDARMQLKRPDIAPENQHVYFFAYASVVELA